MNIVKLVQEYPFWSFAIFVIIAIIIYSVLKTLKERSWLDGSFSEPVTLSGDEVGIFFRVEEVSGEKVRLSSVGDYIPYLAHDGDNLFEGSFKTKWSLWFWAENIPDEFLKVENLAGFTVQKNGDDLLFKRWEHAPNKDLADKGDLSVS